MICPTAVILRERWWKASVQLFGDITADELKKIANDRKKPEYQAALDELRKHIENCPLCRMGKA